MQSVWCSWTAGAPPVVGLDLPQLGRQVLQPCCQRLAELGNSVDCEGAACGQLQQACLLGSVPHELVALNKLAAVGVGLSLQGALAGYQLQQQSRS